MSLIHDKSDTYDFLMIQGSYKGRVGEHLFQATRRRLFLTSTFSKELLLSKIKPGLTPEQFDFLDKYWYSVDGLEFVNYVPHLFEIKVRQERYKDYTLTLTQTAAKIYPLAQKLGFVCKVGLVYLQDNWKYKVKCIDFELSDFIVDGLTKFDKDVGIIHMRH